MQGVWAVLLSYYSGEVEVVFGAVVSGRPAELAGVESMIGMFINTLPVRIRVSAEEALMPWLRALQEEQSEMNQYEYSPLVQVQRWSDVSHGRTLFESVLVFENYPVDVDLNEPGSSLRVRTAPSLDSTHYPLSITAWPGQEMRFSFSYDTHHFNPLAVRRMAEHLKSLLQRIAAQPAVSLRDLRDALAAADEQQQIDRGKELEKARLDKLKQVRRRTTRV
jgi:non-ribosomal peptide synthetase component F